MIQVRIELKSYVVVPGQPFFPEIEILAGDLIVARALQDEDANLEFRCNSDGIVSAQVEEVARRDISAQESDFIRFFQVWTINFLDHQLNGVNLFLGLVGGNTRKGRQIVNLIVYHFPKRPRRAREHDDSRNLRVALGDARRDVAALAVAQQENSLRINLRLFGGELDGGARVV